MISGSCCCGEVTFEIDEKPSMLGMCHCSRCRKLGAIALAFVKSNQFRITADLDKISTIQAEQPYKYNRCICSECGTALGEVLSEMDSFPINANFIDTELSIDNKFHEFVSEKPS